MAAEPSDPPDTSTEQPPAPENPEDTVISALQHQGDVRFRSDDYAGARESYLDALARVPRGSNDAAFRVSLIVLVVNATVAEFAVAGDHAPVREVIQLVEAERAAPDLEPELAEILDEATARLRPLLPPLPPNLPPPPDAEVTLEDGEVAPQGPDPTTVLIVAGSVAVAGGIAAIGAGAAFKPRAVSQVEQSGVAIDDGLPFINREVRKGQAWIGSGAGVAAAGLGMLITGVVLRLRSRRRSGTELSVAGSGGEVVLGLRGRW